MQTKFRKFGVMLDCSRNAVMTVPTLLPFCEGLPRFNDWSGNFTTNVVF